jgi:hypothetical protein
MDSFVHYHKFLALYESQIKNYVTNINKWCIEMKNKLNSYRATTFTDLFSVNHYLLQLETIDQYINTELTRYTITLCRYRLLYADWLNNHLCMLNNLNFRDVSISTQSYMSIDGQVVADILKC